MERGKSANACLVIFVVSVLTLQSLSTLAHCSRRIQEGFAEEKHYFGPSTPYSGSPPKHSSSPSCNTPGGGSGHNGGSSGSGHNGGHDGGSGHRGGHGGGSGHSTPTTPSHGSGPVYHNTPPSNTGGGSPPYSTPATPVPSPPVDYDHSVPPYHPGTCSYWSAHPDKIKAVIGYFGTIADFFGAACIFAYGGKNPTLHDAVANTNTDGYSALLREGTAALLNSIACKTFSLKQQQVKSCFLGALGNEGAAAAQAAVFKSANEGIYKS